MYLGYEYISRRQTHGTHGALLKRFTLLFEFAFGEGGGFLQGFLDAPGSRFGSAVIENREQVPATVRGRHAHPALEGTGVARESCLQDRRQFVLCVHNRDQALSHLFGAPDAGLRALDLDNPLANLAASGVVQFLEPSPQVGIFLEETF